MATAKTSEAIVVPGVDNINQVPQNQSFAIFVRGLEAFTSISSDKVTVKGKNGDSVEATVLGTKPGRLFTLANEMMSQAASSILAGQRPGGYNFLDTAFFNSLTDAYGKGSTEALEPYTVILAMIPMQYQDPTAGHPVP